MILFVSGEVYGLILSNLVTLFLELKGVVVNRIRGGFRAGPGIVLLEGGERRTGNYQELALSVT